MRGGAFLTWERIRVAAVCAAAGFAIGLYYLLGRDNSFTSQNGTLMVDYLGFWLAGGQVWLGDPALAYDRQAFSALQANMSGSDTVFGFFFPPTFQMIQSVFSLLSYKISLVAFLAATTGLLLLVCQQITGRWRWAICLILVPVSLNNAFYGQDAALMAALIGVSLFCLERGRYMLAGIAIGLLAIKPQVAVLIPLALIAAGYWRALASAVVTTLLIAGLSVFLLGVSTWEAFWAQVPLAAAALDQGPDAWAKMISVYGGLRVLGAEQMAAMAAQAAVGVIAAVCVWTAWRCTFEMAVRSAVLVGGILLTTPFAQSCDLTLLIVPCAYLIRAGYEDGFRPYEKIGLALVIVLSAAPGPMAVATGLPVAPLLAAIIFLFGMRRLVRMQQAGAVPRDGLSMAGS